MNMKLDSLRIPLHLAPLLGEVYSFKALKNNANGNVEYLVPESWLVKLIEAVSRENESGKKKNEQKNEKSELNLFSTVDSNENQLFNPYLPKEIVEIVKKENCGLVRAIMTFRGYSLKEVAARYGGASAAANLANIMARPNDSLAVMRPATLKRLAQALSCPVEWLEIKTA